MAHGDITHVEIPVSDNDTATAFYSALFGWEFQVDPDMPDYPMWQAPNQVSGGGLVERTAERSQPLAFVEVDSIDDTVEQATASGGKLMIEKTPIPEMGAWACISDPDGNAIGLYEGLETDD